MNLDWEAAVLNVSLLWMLTVPHEFAHAWVAKKLGDDTPEREGRVTLNPMAHVDWLGTVILPAITSLFGGGFLGWGRAVNTNPAAMRGGLNGLALVALAGPASNVVFALILAGVTMAVRALAPDFVTFPLRGVYMSLYLALFNLVPLPPLDGSKLWFVLRLPMALYHEIARAGFLLLLVLFSVTPLGSWLSRTSYLGTQWLLGLFR